MNRRLLNYHIVLIVGSVASLAIFVQSVPHVGLISALLTAYIASFATVLIWLAFAAIVRKLDAIGSISAMLLVALGPCGGFMVLLLSALLVFDRDRSEDMQWLIDSGKDGESTPAIMLHRRLLSLNAQKGDNTFFCAKPIVPLLDVVQFGSLVEKRRALTQIGRYFKPEFIPALQTSLQDSSNLVRVHAASIITLIRGRLISRENSLEKKIATGKTLDQHQLELARAKAERAESGLLDGDSPHTVRSQAIDALKALERKGFLGTDDQLLLTNLLIDQERYREARPLIRKLMLQPRDSSEETTKVVERWFLGSKRYASLARYARWNSRRTGIIIQFKRLKRREETLHVV